MMPRASVVASLCVAAFVAASATPVDAQVQVGAGSYATVRPPGTNGPSMLASCNPHNPTLSPARIKRTANVTGPVPTNEWWSSLIFQRCGEDPWGTPMVPDPVAADAGPDGLAVNYGTFFAINNEYHGLFKPWDLVLGVAGLNSPDTKVDAFSDFAVTALWNDGARTLRATLMRGSPYVFATKTGGNAQVKFEGPVTVFASNGSYLGVTVQNASNQFHHYGLFAPAGSTWTRADRVFQSTLAGKDYFTLALLPAPGDIEIFTR